MRHAYLILAHAHWKQLRTLLALLDDERNDIFVHVDLKTDITPFLQAECRHSKLTFTRQRIDCRWGTVSLVEAEFLLFEEARNQGRYACYHLLSGQDFPIKSQDYIHRFTESHPGVNYISYVEDSRAASVPERALQYHFLIHRPGVSLKGTIMTRLRKGFVKIQQCLHIRRQFPFPIRKGAQWVSISDDFCAYLMERSADLLRLFKRTYGPDEMVIQSVFASSPFAGTQYRPKGSEYEQCLREIDWERGEPYTWTEEDLPFLMASDKWFARKVSSAHTALLDQISASPGARLRSVPMSRL